MTNPANKPRIVCISGSMRFEDEIREAAREESAAGAIVVLPLCNMKQPHRLWTDPADVERLKTELDRLHLAKIDLADEVLVVAPGGYNGDSTRAEITHAEKSGKPVRYREHRTAAPVPVEDTDTPCWDCKGSGCPKCSDTDACEFAWDGGFSCALTRGHEDPWHEDVHGVRYHDDEPAPAVPSTVDTSTRERIARALADSRHIWWQTPPRFDEAADAMLAALPELTAKRTRPHVGAHVEVKPHNGKSFGGTVMVDDGVHLWVTPDDAPNVAGRYLPDQLAVIT